MAILKRYPIAIRVLVLLLALLAWINPRWPLGAPAGDVIVLIDDSQSVDRAFKQTVWKTLAEQIRQLPAPSRFALVRFGAQPALELPLDSVSSPAVAAALENHELPRRLVVDETATNIEAALLAALRLTAPGRAASVVLVTDGQQTRSDAATALTALADAGVRVWVLRPARDAPTKDAWIDHLHLPAQAREGDAVPVTITLDGRHDVHGELRVLVDDTAQISRPVSRLGGVPTTLRVTLPALAPGPRRITVVFDVADDPVVDNNRASRVVNVEGAGRILYVHDNTAPTPAARSLRAGGWTVTETQAALFARAMAHSDVPSLIVLDDIAADDMTDSAWMQLETAVRLHGAGLLVLGGPHSFAAGAYRHSRLEGMLPVIAEAHRPTPRAAVLFVVDKSGSMDRGQSGISRLSMARLGVVGSASALLEGDLVGLLGFDAAPRELLPIDSHRMPAVTLDRAWRLSAQGGTQLRPALRAGIERLRAVQVPRRMLVLVTDGFTQDEDLESLARQLRELAVEVVALVIGRNEEIPSLERLVHASHGTLLRVDQLAELPRMMRREVEQRRKPAELGRHVPIQQQPLPFLSDVAAWPALTGYMVARPRSNATVFLQSRHGDPLLAAHEVGTGRAAVVTGGLGAWAQSWWGWSHWGRFIGGMSAWLSARSGNPRLYLRLQEQGGGQQLAVEALSAHGEWSTANQGNVRVYGPGDDTREYPMARPAPGRYTSALLLPRAGTYRALIQVGEESRYFEFVHAPKDERIPVPGAEQTFSSWLAAGWMQLWRPGEPLLPQPSDTGHASGWRTVLLLVCVALYLGVLIAERVHVSWPLPLHRLNQWAGRLTGRGSERLATRGRE